MTTAPDAGSPADPDFVLEHGHRRAREHEVLRTVVGSGLHGIAVEGTDDHDEMGVHVETPEQRLGVRRTSEHYVARTQPEGARSGPGDTDLVLYSLRKFLRLAVKGHPTVLLPLFAGEDDVVVLRETGRRLRELGPSLLSQESGHRFLGYLRSQRDRVAGAAGRGVPNRPELVAAHGYDTKYASHALRLALQGLEVVGHGRLTLPMPAEEREVVLSVKRGERSREQALDLVDLHARRLEDLLASGRSPLPERVDVAAVDAWSTAEHLAHWRRAGLLG
ncbi:DNA polymerase beta superfamily protein [uncultured Pseudokineococcus sp.]|uniref:DNA polymerase beta superfamily protein n=1 Tax=uncultured Pseudokineococcus sp. TaxID=1642928 RepID=UPI00261A6A15|nr:nucleotidyltransferase domain-containing protein [uncultured Pseudokineococcus sp.]